MGHTFKLGLPYLSWALTGIKNYEMYYRSTRVLFSNKFRTILNHFVLYWSIFSFYLGLSSSMLDFSFYIHISFSILVFLVLSHYLSRYFWLSLAISGYLCQSLTISGYLGLSLSSTNYQGASRGRREQIIAISNFFV